MEERPDLESPIDWTPTFESRLEFGNLAAAVQVSDTGIAGEESKIDHQKQLGSDWWNRLAIEDSEQTESATMVIAQEEVIAQED